MSESKDLNAEMKVYNNGELNLGFLNITQEHTGIYGGYLLTNLWGRPIEFRLTTAVQPSRVQAILYGSTLMEYIHGELIGKTLVEKSSCLPAVIITNSIPSLVLQNLIGIPVIALHSTENSDLSMDGLLALKHPRSTADLLILQKYRDSSTSLLSVLDQLDTALDLAEPFSRIREALQEARKTGGSRAA